MYELSENSLLNEENFMQKLSFFPFGRTVPQKAFEFRKSSAVIILPDGRLTLSIDASKCRMSYKIR